jgi:ketosteroid isomerase-like protein
MPSLRGDIDAIAALLAPDVMALSPDGPIVAGREAVRQLWASAIREHGMTTCQLTTVAGDVASEVGHATMTMTPSGGKCETAKIKCVVVWKRLARARRRSMCLDVTGIMLADRMLDLRAGGAVLALAYGRSYREVTGLFGEARRLRLPIVLVSETAESALAKFADVVLEIPRGKRQRVALHSGTLVGLDRWCWRSPPPMENRPWLHWNGSTPCASP